MWILWKHSLRFHEAPSSRHFLKHQASAAISGLLTAPCGEIAGAECLWMLAVSLHVQNMEFVFSGHQTWNVATQEHNQTICAPVGCYRETSSQWIPTHFLLISPWNCWLWEENHGKAFKTLSPKQNSNIDPTIKESSSPTMTASLVPVCPSGFQLGSFQPGLRRAKRWRRKALPGDLLPQVRMKPSQWSEVKIVKWLSCMVRYGEIWWVMFIPKIPICTSLYTSPSCSLIRISKMRVLEPRSGVEALPWRSENLEPHFL